MESARDHSHLGPAVLLGAEPGRPGLGKEDALAVLFHGCQGGIRVRKGTGGLDAAAVCYQPEDVFDGVRIFPEPDGQVDHAGTVLDTTSSSTANLSLSAAASAAKERWCSTYSALPCGVSMGMAG